MDRARWKQIDEIVGRLLELKPEERVLLLDQVCRQDPDLCREVEEVLGAEAELGDFLQEPAEIGGELFVEEVLLEEGQEISHYRILEKVAEGGMGLIYRAEDSRLSRQVALKLLPRQMGNDRAALERFKQEARAASGLNHPNVCTVHDIGEYEGQPFIVMEFLRGRTLADQIQKGPMEMDQVVDVAVQIAGALGAAHSKGIVHRDIKPGNVVITWDGRVKLLDFGLAKFLSRTGTDRGSSGGEGPLTSAGIVLGTPFYMSPEQLLGEELDGRCDIFSLGVVLYQMAAGRLPFQGPDLRAIFYAIINERPQRAVQCNPDVPQALESIINRALEKKRENRYSSIEEMEADLKALAGSDASSVPRTGAAPDRFEPGTLRPFWWVVHQINVLLFYGAMVVAMWLLKTAVPGGPSLGLFLGVCACTALSGTLRVHLLFTRRFNPPAAAVERRRVTWAVRSSDGIFSLCLLAGGVLAAPGFGVQAGILAALAIGYAVVVLVVEPATTRGAFPDNQ